MVVASKAARKAIFLVTLTHDRNGATDATLVAAPALEFLNEVGTIYGVLTVTGAISGSSTAQVMQLKIASSEDAIQVCVKRVKI
jgi:hypothetical protein